MHPGASDAHGIWQNSWLSALAAEQHPTILGGNDVVKFKIVLPDNGALTPKHLTQISFS